MIFTHFYLIHSWDPNWYYFSDDFDESWYAKKLRKLICQETKTTTSSAVQPGSIELKKWLYIYESSLAWWLECSAMARETRVQS